MTEQKRKKIEFVYEGKKQKKGKKSRLSFISKKSWLTQMDEKKLTQIKYVGGDLGELLEQNRSEKEKLVTRF